MPFCSPGVAIIDGGFPGASGAGESDPGEEAGGSDNGKASTCGSDTKDDDGETGDAFDHCALVSAASLAVTAGDAAAILFSSTTFAIATRASSSDSEMDSDAAFAFTLFFATIAATFTFPLVLGRILTLEMTAFLVV